MTIHRLEQLYSELRAAETSLVHADPHNQQQFDEALDRYQAANNEYRNALHEWDRSAHLVPNDPRRQMAR